MKNQNQTNKNYFDAEFEIESEWFEEFEDEKGNLLDLRKYCIANVGVSEGDYAELISFEGDEPTGDYLSDLLCEAKELFENENKKNYSSDFAGFNSFSEFISWFKVA